MQRNIGKKHLLFNQSKNPAQIIKKTDCTNIKVKKGNSNNNLKMPSFLLGVSYNNFYTNMYWDL